MVALIGLPGPSSCFFFTFCDMLDYMLLFAADDGGDLGVDLSASLCDFSCTQGLALALIARSRDLVFSDGSRVRCFEGG